ncbi:putative serine/threonine-protein kinase [Tetrabaena socialis]|uniref:Putative serine/threonine-protein kinase n=1 Tax=Tetrabaena socialis TaxID=47790 RepID=A0A2J8AFR7_9CHLO|nr:putative serine/threonine-protein kinase [Tetrabaena socialis]|eukprot:PNH11364.1 putative serine/threonine-protein kinase [Tetrabaena socialis]
MGEVEVQLLDGVTLRAEEVILVNARVVENFWRAPGLDILAASPAGTVAAGFVGSNIAVIADACFPEAMDIQNVEAAARPPGVPGVQSYSFGVAQPGCVNTTSAPLIRRCWPYITMIHDSILAGADPDFTGGVGANNYQVALFNVSLVCALVLKILVQVQSDFSAVCDAPLSKSALSRVDEDKASCRNTPSDILVGQAAAANEDCLRHDMQRVSSGGPTEDRSGQSCNAADASHASAAPAWDVVTLLPEVLGRGAFGRVHAGIYRGQRVAVKQVLDILDGGMQDMEHQQAAFAQELEVLGRCEHPNILRVLAACVTPPKPCIVMELMDTSLDKLLYGREEILPLPLVLHIASEIAQGLAYLHPTVLHRDLKPANVLINDPWGTQPVVKLADFGLSRLRNTILITQRPDAGTDMYSFGVCLWEMLAGARPWEGLSAVPIACQIQLLDGVMLRAEGCILGPARSVENFWRAPGLDILAASPAGTVGAGFVASNMASRAGACFPEALMIQNMAAVQRPPSVPGLQRYSLGCLRRVSRTNSTGTPGSSCTLPAASSTLPDSVYTPGLPDVVTLLPEVLGRGAFGRVHAGIYRGQRVAVKQVLDILDGGVQDVEDLQAAFAQELEVLGRCEHPNILRVLAACVTPPRPCLIMELMDTSLDKLLYGREETLPLPLPLPRPLPLPLPANVLINDPRGEQPVVKLADFGLSRLRNTILVTEHPEAGTDIYSFGVCLWEMLAGARPWEGLSAVPIACQVTLMGRRLPVPPQNVPGDSPSRWPPRLCELLEECWDKDPDRRPAAAELAKRLLQIKQNPSSQNVSRATIELALEAESYVPETIKAIKKTSNIELKLKSVPMDSFQYLAEAYATVKLGVPEEGFGFAPGVLYMASQVRKAATAAAAAGAGGADNGRGQRQQQQPHSPPPLLSLEVETVAPGSLTVKAAAEEVASPPPRLKVRRLAGGTVELSLRQHTTAPISPI